MSRSVLLMLDLVAIAILVFGLYFPRHRRRDMVVAYLGVNIGVLVVAVALSSTAVGAGLGLGLFGVLSIIRLRSAELDQVEVAYYFAALALGLLAGIEITPDGLAPALTASLLVVLFLGDHPRLFRRYRVQVLNLDAAFTNEVALRSHLEQLLNAEVHRVVVRRVDLVNDTTLVEARYQVLDQPSSGGQATSVRFLAKSNEPHD
jgi:Domain of unknown function (DUF4956)